MQRSEDSGDDGEARACAAGGDTGASPTAVQLVDHPSHQPAFRNWPGSMVYIHSHSWWQWQFPWTLQHCCKDMDMYDKNRSAEEALPGASRLNTNALPARPRPAGLRFTNAPRWRRPPRRDDSASRQQATSSDRGSRLWVFSVALAGPRLAPKKKSYKSSKKKT